MKIIHACIAISVSIGLMAAATVPVQAYKPSSSMDHSFGRSVESAKFKQIINHEPVENKAVEGLDGQAAVKVMQQYRKSFTKDTDVGESGISGLGSK